MTQHTPEMNHTPGPWKAEGRTPNLTIVFAGEPRAGVARSSVCVMADGFDEDIAANARLIAAAPDMLRALQSIRDLGGIDAGDPSSIILSAAGHLECRRIARAAIAKAIGDAK